jgi:flagellar motor switch protein FliG
MTAQATYSGIERAAILMMTLGESAAAAVLKQLDAKVVQRIGSSMAQITGVSREGVSSVLNKFSTDLELQTSIGVDSDQYLRNVLKEALGADKANAVIDRILGGRSSRGLEALKWMEAKQVADMLRNEHPQIISIVLSYLDSDQSAAILNAMPEIMRADIITRIATLEGVHPSALDELDQVLEKQFSGGGASKSSGFGGPKVAAGILNLVGTATEGKIVEEIGKTDTNLAQKIQDLMFVFDDLIDIDDRGMQELMREINNDKLVIALKGADDELKERFFKNMSSRVSETLREDLESKGPVKLSEVEAVHKEILVIARRMSDEGRIQLGGKGGDEYV